MEERYAELIFKVRDLGVALSDRRAVKVLKLVAASALLCGRMRAAPSDLWVLRYVWDREEQMAPLTALVDGLLRQQGPEDAAHPLAEVPEQVAAEELARQVESIEGELKEKSLSLARLAALRERASDLADRAAWVSDERQRKHLHNRLAPLLEKLR